MALYFHNQFENTKQLANRLLILLNGGLGDACHIVPIVFALSGKNTEMQIDVLFASHSAKKMFRLFFPDSDVIISSDLCDSHEKLSQLLKWRQKRYDYVVSGAHPYSWKTALISYLIKPGKKIGLNTEKLGFLYDIRVNEPKSKSYYVKFYSLFEKLGVDKSDICLAKINFKEKLHKLAINNTPSWLRKRKNILKIAFANGADRIARGIWNPDLKKIPNNVLSNIFLRLKQEFPAEYILLGIDEDTFPEEMKSESSVLDLRGKTSLVELISTLCDTDLLISNDTGIMHLAYFCDTPYLGIFGPTDPEQYAPDRVKENIIHPKGHCIKCYPKPICKGDYCEMFDALDVNKVITLAKYKLEERNKIFKNN